jgi:hypothetical protein
MRRIRAVLAVASMALLLMAFAAVPAMAQGNGNTNNGNNSNDRHLDRQDASLDRQLLNENNGFDNRFGFDDNSDFFDFGVPLFFSNGFGLNDSCPFWGDTEGIVNQWDCVN